MITINEEKANLRLRRRKTPLKLRNEQTEIMITSNSAEKIVLEIEGTIEKLKMMRDELLFKEKLKNSKIHGN